MPRYQAPGKEKVKSKKRFIPDDLDLDLNPHNIKAIVYGTGSAKVCTYPLQITKAIKAAKCHCQATSMKIVSDYSFTPSVSQSMLFASPLPSPPLPSHPLLLMTNPTSSDLLIQVEPEIDFELFAKIGEYANRFSATAAWKNARSKLKEGFDKKILLDKTDNAVPESAAPAAPVFTTASQANNPIDSDDLVDYARNVLDPSVFANPSFEAPRLIRPVFARPMSRTAVDQLAYYQKLSQELYAQHMYAQTLYAQAIFSQAASAQAASTRDASTQTTSSQIAEEEEKVKSKPIYFMPVNH